MDVKSGERVFEMKRQKGIFNEVPFEVSFPEVLGHAY